MLPHMVQVTKDMRGTSMKFYNDKPIAWNARDRDAIHFTNFEGQKLYNLGALQVLSIIPDLEDDIPSLNTRKCILKGAEDTMGVTLMKEEVKGKEVKGKDKTLENHDEDQMHISAMEDGCNANVNNVVECNIISWSNGLRHHNRTRHK